MLKHGTIKAEQAEAKRCGLKRFHCSVPCKKCNSSVRSTATGDCLECKRDWNLTRAPLIT